MNGPGRWKSPQAFDLPGASKLLIGIRAPRPDEWNQVEHLLPQVRAAADNIECLAAVMGPRERVVGCAAWWQSTLESEKNAARFVLRVIKPQRGKGIGRALLNALFAKIEATGVEALITAISVQEQTPAYHLLISSGFAHSSIITQFEVDAANFRKVLEPVYKKLKARNKIPSNARLVSIREVPLDVIRKLVMRQLGGDYYRLGQHLAPGPRGFDRDFSIALMVANEVKGVLLARRKGDIKINEAIAITPGLRGGWAHLFLKYGSLMKTFAAGISKIRFSADAQMHFDTVKLAKRCDATILGRLITLQRDMRKHSNG